MTSQGVTITDGQASATVTGPLHNNDSATFVVPALAPPPTGYDVGFNGPMSAFDAFLRGNPGRRMTDSDSWRTLGRTGYGVEPGPTAQWRTLAL